MSARAPLPSNRGDHRREERRRYEAGLRPGVQLQLRPCGRCSSRFRQEGFITTIECLGVTQAVLASVTGLTPRAARAAERRAQACPAAPSERESEPTTTAFSRGYALCVSACHAAPRGPARSAGDTPAGFGRPPIKRYLRPAAGGRRRGASGAMAPSRNRKLRAMSRR